jgi:hypothetical protein
VETSFEEGGAMMDAYNIADLEQRLAGEGWTVVAQDWVAPGRVDHGGYTVVLTSPTADTFSGDGPTRTDALRTAAERAGVIRPDQPHLH